ncbi:TetR/AcrR family transcriptional regulator [Micromonospora sp. DR5-3]|uniref:TetR/AcrR family transcriptional regulator n=1 Tax=unclassified Micromonospora TaxID=2617518 RepID=UPI0021030621|nr:MULTISPECIES: TetR/AcrR family transcriptional regulator [unclassified Micromonospora]MCW3819448.1 TetR/AcrR family transcriptional regulator [Micromonospora sp. DR5-3]
MPLPPANTDRPLRQGSADKRAAIERAALAVFVREGYARASVDAIAAEAGVSKRTIYDYYGDKERLFVGVLTDTIEASDAVFSALLDRTLPADGDLPSGLLAFGREFATAVARSPERAAVMRLMIAEAHHFPALLRQLQGAGATQRMLATRLATFADRGLLDLPDPLEAAGHLGALVTNAVSLRSLIGADLVDEAELDQIVTSGVRVFLRAYRPDRD